MEEVKKVYQYMDIKPVDFENGLFEVHNKYDFTNLSEFVLGYRILANGKEMNVGQIEQIDLAPHGKKNIQLPLANVDFEKGKEYFINFSLIRREVGNEDEIVASEQILLADKTEKRRINIHDLPSLVLEEEREYIVVRGDDFQVGFDRNTGLLDSYISGGTEYLDKPILPNFWRAPNDNDFGNRMDQRQGIWRSAGKNLQLVKLDVQHANASVFRLFAEYYLPDVRSQLEIEYDVVSNGEVLITMQLFPGIEGLPDLPRFGMQVVLKEPFNRLEYYGRGPHENYIDRNTSAFVGHYKSAVSNQYFPYIRPQENGYKTGTRWLILGDRNNNRLMFKNGKNFSFSALHFTTEDLDQLTKENYRYTIDLTPRKETILNIDFRQMGVGGEDSWGAQPYPQYRLPVTNYRFRFSFRPVNKEADPFELWQQTY